MTSDSPFRLVLASRSARRRSLLDEHGIAHTVVPSAIDDGELVAAESEPIEWVTSLAYLKARASWNGLKDRSNRVVLGADTVVVKDGEIIGQPRDQNDARRIVDRLNNGSHHVVTGVAFLNACGDRLLWHDSARVEVGDVPDHDRARYIATGAWRGKAGAYNYSERVEDGWPMSCEDDTTTVMGLPMRMLPIMLSRFSECRTNTGVPA